MTNLKILSQQITNGFYDNHFLLLYDIDKVETAKKRYNTAIKEFISIYGEYEATLFSSPGRTEIGGNHTDHQNGRVLSAAVDPDIIAVATHNNDGVIHIKSDGFNKDIVSLDSIDTTPSIDETGKSSAIIKGVVSGFLRSGFKVGGFNAYFTSNILIGSGLSSSAAFEVLICTIISNLYNSGEIDPVTIAKISQYSETVFFGKPSGLMDQMTCSAGGLIAIDFKEPENPVIERVEFDFEHEGYSLCIVDCGSNHADLTNDYGDITKEMGQVASMFNEDKLRAAFDNNSNICKDDLISKIISIRQNHPDFNTRAILRAAHFFNENKRVVEQVNTLKVKDFERFKELIIESGESSYKYLQNIYSASDPTNQHLSLALFVSEMVLKGKGAWRVHGGGFGGTVQAFVPHDILPWYKGIIENIFGDGSCNILKIRNLGAGVVKL